MVNTGNFLFLIGMSEDTEFPYKLCELSIKHNMPKAEVRPASKLPNSLLNRSNRATNFSYDRLSCPLEDDFEKFEFVIYMDSDQLLLRHIEEELRCVDLSSGFCVVDFEFSYRQTSVIVWATKYFDCENYRKHLHESFDANLSVDEIVFSLGAVEILPDRLNTLDWVSKSTVIVHFTYMPTQPWVNIKSIMYKFYLDTAKKLLNATDPRTKDEIKKIYFKGVQKGHIHPRFFSKVELKKLEWTGTIQRPLFFMPLWIKNNHKLRNNVVADFVISLLEKLKII